MIIGRWSKDRAWMIFHMVWVCKVGVQKFMPSGFCWWVRLGGSLELVMEI